MYAIRSYYDRHTEVLEQFAAADGAGLVAAADAAHAFGEQDHAPAGAKDARDFLDGVDIRRKT